MLASLISKFVKNKELKLEVGRVYLNREGDAVAIVGQLDPFEYKAFSVGFDFRDAHGNNYYANGRCIKDREHKHDLVAPIR